MAIYSLLCYMNAMYEDKESPSVAESFIQYRYDSLTF